MNLLQWISHRLEAQYLKAKQYLYQESQKIVYIFFIQKGEFHFVLPRYAD